MSIQLYSHDIPSDLKLQGSLAVDTEATGLDLHRDRLCVVQVADEVGTCAVVHFPLGEMYQCPHLKALLTDTTRRKIFHYARFDLAMLEKYLGVWCEPVFCTKIASRLVRTYTERHGLKDLAKELLGVELSKTEQSTDWAKDKLTAAQVQYAANDVLYLHKVSTVLEQMLAREKRTALANDWFKGLRARVQTDLMGWGNQDIFAH